MARQTEQLCIESPEAAVAPGRAELPRDLTALALTLQRSAGNRATAQYLQRRVLAREWVPHSVDYSKLSDAQLAAEREGILGWMQSHGADDPLRSTVQESSDAVDREVSDRNNRHTGGTAAQGIIGGWDANVRITKYVDPVKKLSQQVLDDYKAGKLTHLEARQAAASGRNAALQSARDELSPGGRAFSEAIKDEGKTLPELTAKYADKVVRANPTKYGLQSAEELADAAKLAKAVDAAKGSAEVSEEIIKAAGRTGKAVTVMARVSRVAGPVGAGVGLAISGYEVYNAPEGQGVRVATREGGGFAGGMIGAAGGGLVAGWAASLACGPGAPVCAIAISMVIIGASGYAGSRAGESSATWVYDGGLRDVGKAFGELAIGFGEWAKSPAIGGPATVLSVGGGFGGLMERDRRRVFGPQPVPSR